MNPTVSERSTLLPPPRFHDPIRVLSVAKSRSASNAPPSPRPAHPGAPLRSGALPRPPCSNCTLLHTATRPPITQPAQETVLGSAVPSLATPPAPCLQRFHSGLRQVRFLRKLMPGEGFYMHVLCYLLKTLERYAVPAAVATCCPCFSVHCSPHASSLTWCCALLSFVHSSGVLHLPHGPY